MTAQAMRPLFCLLLVTAASAVETKPVPVLRVIDGNTIEVGADLGGVQVPVRVRLAHLYAPVSDENNHGEATPIGRNALLILHDHLPQGTMVRLWGCEDQLDIDDAGCPLAIVIEDPSSAEGFAPGIFDPTTGWAESVKLSQSVQCFMLRTGQSPYWRGHGDAPEPWHASFTAIQEDAKVQRQGAWATAPQWMQEKADERPETKGEKP